MSETPSRTHSADPSDLVVLEPPSELDTPPPTRVPRTFDAFKDINYRWFFAALCGNFASMNMQMFVRGWLVFEITGSYEKLGWISAAGGLCGAMSAPIGGVIADRVRQKKHIIQVCQSINSMIALSIASLIAFHMLKFEHLLIAAVVQGLTQNAMNPARQALTKDVVGVDRLTNAIALSTSGMNTARLLLPGLAGGMVGMFGGGHGNIEPARWVYFLMSGLYLSSVVTMFKVDVADRAAPIIPHGSFTSEIALGFRYVLHQPIMRMLLGCNVLMIFFSMPYFMLLPGFAKQVLHAGPDKLGFMMSISGVGSLVGSLIIASMPNRNRARVLLSGSLLLGVALVFFATSTVYWVSASLLVIVGLGQSARMSLSNVLIQSYVDDDFRGRVMSIYMLEMSLTQVCIYPISMLADRLGPQWAVGLSAGGLIFFVLVLFATPAYRNLH